MLYKETVSQTTLELIKALQKDPEFSDFILAGGTALALQIGHRISVDIDFFTRKDFNINDTLEYLEQNYSFQMQFSHKNTLKGIIQGVFVDFIFIKHDYKIIDKLVEEEGVKLASRPDIAAMKVNAITGDGTRIKDFIDVYFLLQEFGFGELIEFYKEKYATRNDFHAVKSLTYFEDIDPGEWPRMLKEEDLTLEKVKKKIEKERDNYLESLT
jgi:hypothetical protein